MRRLSSVPAQDELPLGDDAIELVRDRPQSAEEPTTEVPASPPLPDPLAETADADWIATPTPAPDDVPLPVAETEAESDERPGHRADEPAVPEDETPVAGPAQEGPLLGAVVGRDHVRRRQGRPPVTRPTRRRAVPRGYSSVISSHSRD